MAIFLNILQGPGKGHVLQVPSGQPITLGRSAQASYAFDDPLLSRRHCAVECRGELCRIVDLQSRNGTFVNGQRVGAVLLNPGDMIKIGALVIEVSSSAAPAGDGAPPALTGQAVQVRDTTRPPGGGAPEPLDVAEDLIEGFRILRKIEVTSFGTTYLAQQRLMERLVVLKIIDSGTATDPRTLRRFMREAKTGGRLAHPSIVELYDVNEQGELMYIVTEYVEGERLDRILTQRRAPLPVPQGTLAMYQIAEAMAYAHEQQIVHRDVKPANIIVRRSDRRAKLQGFALAKNLERAGLSIITADGESIGTPYYMPPEQVKSAKSADVRSDIYSWAATTFHCLAGRVPLEARSYGEFIEKVFSSEAPPLLSINKDVPAPLSELIARCLGRDPASRPEAMPLVVEQLEPLLRDMKQLV